MRTTRTVVFCLVSIFCGLARLEAAVMSPATVVGTVAVPVLDNSFGVLEVAYNFGGSTLTRDGIAFVGALSPGGNPISLATAPFVVGMAGDQSGLFNATVGPDPLFETEIFATGALAPVITQTLTISGLDASRAYQFQFLHGDTRPTDLNQFDVSFTDSLGNVATTNLMFGNPGAGSGTPYGPYALMTVTATGTTSLTYQMPATGPRGPSMSGLAIHSTIHSTPEPGTFVLAALGIGALVLLRRPRSSRQARS